MYEKGFPQLYPSLGRCVIRLVLFIPYILDRAFNTSSDYSWHAWGEGELGKFLVSVLTGNRIFLRKRPGCQPFVY